MDQVRWYRDPDGAMLEAREKGRPVLLYFFSPT
jgi:hypothetical protein